jgi:hypothetical protein
MSYEVSPAKRLRELFEEFTRALEEFCVLQSSVELKSMETGVAEISFMLSEDGDHEPAIKVALDRVQDRIPFVVQGRYKYPTWPPDNVKYMFDVTRADRQLPSENTRMGHTIRCMLRIMHREGPVSVAYMRDNITDPYLTEVRNLVPCIPSRGWNGVLWTRSKATAGHQDPSGVTVRAGTYLYELTDRGNILARDLDIDS